jgi:hypothetical protein
MAGQSAALTVVEQQHRNNASSRFPKAKGASRKDTPGRGLLRPGNDLFAFPVATTELVHATAGVDDLLFAGVKGMALRAYLDIEIPADR